MFRNLRLVIGSERSFLRFAHKGNAGAKQSRAAEGQLNEGLNRKWAITVNATGESIVCWHPASARAVPYSCTRELPRNIEELRRGESPLRIRVNDEAIMQSGGPTDAQLAQLFHTTKHPWFPISRTKKKMRHADPDRKPI